MICTHFEATRAIADYLERHCEGDKNAELNSIVSDVKKELDKRQKVREWKGTKEYIREHYKGWYNDDLEDEVWFIDWLDELNEFGNQMFVALCGKCKGEGEVPRFLGEGMEKCYHCRGEGIVEGPQYCRDKDCSGDGPHLVHGYHPSKEGAAAIKKAAEMGDDKYGAAINPRRLKEVNND